MALGSTQHLTEVSVRSISWGKRRPVLRADNLHMPTVSKSGSLKLLETSGPVQACAVIAFICNYVPAAKDVSRVHDIKYSL